MQNPKKLKVTLLKACVVDGENCKQFDDVSPAFNDAVYLIGCGTAADPRTDEGKEAVTAAKNALRRSKDGAARAEKAAGPGQ
jgi:hypothetical protein